MTDGIDQSTPPGTGPQGREAVVKAILEACESLSERVVPSAFTIVDLAQEAKITTSLLYFYFESKDAIVIATLQKIAKEADGVASQYENADEMAQAVKEFVWRRPGFPRIITSLVLEGRDITALMGDHPFLQRLMAAAAQADPDDPQTAAGREIIDILATAVYGPGINRVLGREMYDPRIAGLEEQQ